MKPAMQRDFLIALMNNKRDFKIAQEQHWYRIPVKTKQTPKSVIDKSLRHIAFYHTNVFGQNAHSIRWYGEVKNISIVKRKELLPELPNDPKAEHDYYKIQFGELQARAQPIISRRPRRILFIPTTMAHFELAHEINEVFYESPLEEAFWKVSAGRCCALRRMKYKKVSATPLNRSKRRLISWVACKTPLTKKFFDIWMMVHRS